MGGGWTRGSVVPGLCCRDGDGLSFLDKDWLLGEALRFLGGRTGLLGRARVTFLRLLRWEGATGPGVSFIRGSTDTFPDGLCP